MSAQLEYTSVKNYLETYSTAETPYDFNGLLHLVLAGAENLRRHGLDQDFLDYACAITDDQTLFLRRLLDCRAESIAQLDRDT
jgi:hypothetical protein